MSGEMYYLMHKNRMVVALEIDSTSGVITKIGSNVNKNHLPPGGNQSQEALKKWWNRRAVPLSQGKIRQILEEKNISTPQELLLKNLGLSLNDCYWIRPLQLDVSWEDVNLFENDFIDEIGEWQFGVWEEEKDFRETGMTPSRNPYCPSASTQGDMQKKWTIQDGKRCLVKCNTGASNQQCLNEVFATSMHEMQNRFPFVKYNICNPDERDKTKIGCVSENFCGPDIEFISALDIAFSVKKQNQISEFEHLIQVCTMNGLPEEEVRSFLEYQILTDFLITNTDRHFYNFGVLRDAETLKFVKMAPVFDSGNSMFWDDPSLPLNHDLLDIPVNSFKKKEVKLLEYVSDFSLLCMERIPSLGQLEEI